MGSGCSANSSISAKNPDLNIKNTSLSKSKDHIDKVRSLIFNNEESLSDFNNLISPRSGNLIKWKRGELIGQGSYAKVYQCINISNGELLAVKSFYLSDQPSKIEKEFNNMKKEISLLKKLNHPNIVKYYQTDLSQDMYTIDVLLEYAPGGSLKNILGKYYPLEMEIIKTYSKQLLNALDYLHSNFIVHRDLKSANILISFSGELKLSDLGSSIALEDPEKGLGKSFKGSPYWMAPEVVLRQGHSYPADIWSFGCVLIEMVAGQPPWSNYSRETREVLCLISKEDQLPDIPNTIPELRSVIIACLNRTPNLRPTTKTLISMPFFQTVFNNI